MLFQNGLSKYTPPKPDQQAVALLWRNHILRQFFSFSENTEYMLQSQLILNSDTKMSSEILLIKF